jgi:hypothetical protein
MRRSSKTFLFNLLIVEATNRMVGLAIRPWRLYEVNPQRRDRLAFMDDMHELIYSVLSPTEIKDISVGVLQQLTERINEVTGSIETELFIWVRKQFTTATTYTIHGPENPFAMDPELEEPFWGFDACLVRLIVGIFPSLTTAERDA